MQVYYEPFLPPTLVLALSIEKQACHHRAASPWLTFARLLAICL